MKNKNADSNDYIFIAGTISIVSFAIGVAIWVFIKLRRRSAQEFVQFADSERKPDPVEPTSPKIQFAVTKLKTFKEILRDSEYK